jgi:hypothetical protein
MTEPERTAAHLVDTGPIFYPGPAGLVWRPCRTWHTPHGYVSVATELGDDGPSVTTAAGLVHDLLQNARPGCRVIEHYPPHEGGAGQAPRAETFAEILIATPGGAVTWRHIPTPELYALLGPTLDTTRPAGPVVPGPRQSGGSRW